MAKTRPPTLDQLYLRALKAMDETRKLRLQCERTREASAQLREYDASDSASLDERIRSSNQKS